MTNEQAKQEAIKKAIDTYYNQYPLVKPYADRLGYFAISNGYVKNLNEHVLSFYYSIDEVDFITSQDHEEYNSHFRPKELSYLINNVENNNGWIRIEPDGSNLPLIEQKYKTIDVDGFEDDNFWYKGLSKSAWNMLNITHYKPIKKEHKPIY